MLAGFITKIFVSSVCLIYSVRVLARLFVFFVVVVMNMTRDVTLYNCFENHILAQLILS